MLKSSVIIKNWLLFFHFHIFWHNKALCNEYCIELALEKQPYFLIYHYFDSQQNSVLSDAVLTFFKPIIIIMTTYGLLFIVIVLWLMPLFFFFSLCYAFIKFELHVHVTSMVMSSISTQDLVRVLLLNCWLTNLLLELFYLICTWLCYSPKDFA